MQSVSQLEGSPEIQELRKKVSDFIGEQIYPERTCAPKT